MSWVEFDGEKSDSRHHNGIEFATIRISESFGQLRPFLLIIQALVFCVAERVDCVYIDEWLMFRSKAFSQFALRIALKLMRVKIIFDMRDPYIDYQIAYGKLKHGSSRHLSLLRQYSLIYRLTDLIVLPSKVYAELFVKEGIPEIRVLGIPRGIDEKLFNPRVDPTRIREKLGLDGKFVIGWFGMMHRYRQIKEILVPLIKHVREHIPNAYVLIGGTGELFGKFSELKKEEPDSPFALLGMIPYQELPQYITACDVLLSPVDPKYRFTRHSVWLKILESVAVGRPIIATRTALSEGDFKHMKGIVWAEANLQSFLACLVDIHNNYDLYSTQASSQAANFRDYSIHSTIPRIAERILEIL